MSRAKVLVVGATVIAGMAIIAGFAVRSFLAPGRGAIDRPPAETSIAGDLSDPNQLVSANAADTGESTLNEATLTGAPLPWSRFRGPNGTGVSNDQAVPTTWSDSENLAWKCALPGFGASSPVLTEQFVFLTSYSGYGLGDRGGDIRKLERQVLCVDRSDGQIVWTKSYSAVQPEDPYEGMGVPEHGYATNTPVTDGKYLYVFLGKSGVMAFDFEGNQIWQRSVGTDSGNRRWGSASSLMLYGDLLIVNAAEESRCIYGLNKMTGEEVWTAPAESLELAYGTPAIAKGKSGRDELVIAVPGEIWGLNPLSGKLYWYAETSLTDNLSPSLIVDGDRLWAFGGYRSSGSVSLRAGGRDDVTDSHVDWTGRDSSYVATPVLFEDKLFWIDDRGIYYCLDANTGESLGKERVAGLRSGGRPVYASPIAIAGKIYVQTRNSGLFVLEPTAELNVIAQNQFASDSSTFNATPAVDAGQLFLRSDKYLYCVAKQ